MMKKNINSEVMYAESGSASPRISHIDKSESSKISLNLPSDRFKNAKSHNSSN